MDIYTAAITLVLVLDPFGNVPVFLATLSRFDPARRRRIIIRENLIALGVLVGFLFFGTHILSGLNITRPALSMAGGTMLFLIAIRMIFPFGLSASEAPADDDPVIVPLAVPQIAGPSSIATITLLSTRYSDRRLEILAALGMAWAASSLVLLASEALRRALGHKLIRAIERLMGMILTTLAVQMLLSGIAEFVGGLS